MADINFSFGADDLKKITAELQKAAKALETAMKKTQRVLDADLKTAKEYAKTAKKVATEKKKLTAIEKEELRQKRALETVTAKLALANSKDNKELIQKQKLLRKVNSELRTGGKNTNAWGKALGSFQFKFNALGNIAANAVSKITQELQRAIKDSVKLASQMEGVEKAFRNLGRPGLLAELQKATRGTVDNLTLMQKAVQAKNFKIPLEQLATYFDFATSRAIQTGESVDYLVDSIITGIGRKSVLVMDNLGISAAELQQEVKKVGDFGLAAGNIIQRELEKAGEVADTTATKIARITTAWTNLQIVAGEKITGGFLARGASAALERWVRILGDTSTSDAVDNFMNFYDTIKDKEAEEQLAAMESRIKTIRDTIEDYATKYRAVLNEEETARGKRKRELKDEIKYYDEIQEGNISLLRVFEEQYNALKNNKDAAKDQATTIKEEVGEIIELYKELANEAGQFASGTFSEDEDWFWNIGGANDPEKKDNILSGVETLLADRQAMEKTYLDKSLEEQEAAEQIKRQKGEKTNELAARGAAVFVDIFEQQKQRELSAAGDNAKKREEIERKYRRRQQLMAIASAIVDGGSSIQKTKAQLGLPAAIPFMIADAVITGTQVGLIASQKFAKGEVDINGPSHARGGISAEIEGGESVINKKSTGKYKNLLQAINDDDQMRIMNAMSRDRKITINGGTDIWNKKLYELMKSKPAYGEDNEYYYKDMGNTVIKVKKE